MDFAAFLRVCVITLLSVFLSACGTYCGYCNFANGSCTDHDITEAVQIRFQDDRCLSYQYLKVSTYERVVSIRGRVENPTQRRIAIEKARSVPCVKGVIADIKIKRPDFT